MSGDLKPMYRMPVSFGPAPGPRNLPADQAHRRYEKKIATLTLSARTDADMLARFLPEGFTLREPRLEVSIMHLTEIGWLAGRGYNILILRIPAAWRGAETVEGDFVPVVWESMADPILTGRDELGWCKINANIPDPVMTDGRWSGSADWEGHRFFEMSAEGFATAPLQAAPLPMKFQKNVPRTGAPGEADLIYPTVTGPDGPPPDILSIAQGRGRFAFRAARWEDMPTQYPIVNALAALPLEEFGPAMLVHSSGGGDASGQRILT
jgi:hypothetical protein